MYTLLNCMTLPMQYSRLVTECMDNVKSCQQFIREDRKLWTVLAWLCLNPRVLLIITWNYTIFVIILTHNFTSEVKWIILPRFISFISKRMRQVYWKFVNNVYSITVAKTFGLLLWTRRMHVFACARWLYVWYTCTISSFLCMIIRCICMSAHMTTIALS